MFVYQRFTILKTIILFFVLLGFGSVFFLSFPRIHDIIIIILSTLLVLLNKGNFSVRVLVSVFFVSIFLICHSIITKSPLFPYAGIIVRLIIIILILSGFTNDYRDIKIHLVKALNLVVYLSCVNIILVLLVPNRFVEITLEDSGYTTNTFLYLFNFLSHGKINANGITLIRNQGPYWEPGVMQGLMNILIYYRLIECNYGINKVKLPILIVISTFSSTGYIILCLILLLKFRYILFSKKRGIAVIIIFIAMVVFIPVMSSNLINKFAGEDKWSFYARMYDTFVGLRISINHFWTGIGYNPDRYFDELKNASSLLIAGQSINLGFRGNTNGIATLLMYFGIPLGALLIFILYHQKIFLKKKIFFLVFCLILVSEPLSITLFAMFLLLSSALRHKTANAEMSKSND
jgi:hypothetical protein